MLKMYYQLDESAEFLAAQTRVPVSVRDVLEAVARKKIRACFWFDGIVTTFRDEGPLDNPALAGGPFEFRGYVQVPPRSISPSGDVSVFCVASIIEVADKIYGEPMPATWTCGTHFMAPYEFDVHGLEGEISVKNFNVTIDEIVIPASDLLDLVPRKPKFENPIGTTERNTLLTIIAALCNYSAIKHQDRGAAMQIAKLTEQLGTAVSDDTVRRALSKIPEALETRTK